MVSPNKKISKYLKQLSRIQLLEAVKDVFLKLLLQISGMLYFGFPITPMFPIPNNVLKIPQCSVEICQTSTLSRSLKKKTNITEE